MPKSIKQWFDNNKKILYWLLFLATFSITVIPLISQIFISICPPNMEWLSPIGEFDEWFLFGVFDFGYGIADVYSLTSFVIAVLLVFVKQNNLNTRNKLIILLYLLLFYIVFTYFELLVHAFEYMAFTDNSECYLHATSWKR